MVRNIRYAMSCFWDGLRNGPDSTFDRADPDGPVDNPEVRGADERRDPVLSEADGRDLRDRGGSDPESESVEERNPPVLLDAIDGTGMAPVDGSKPIGVSYEAFMEDLKREFDERKKQQNLKNYGLILKAVRTAAYEARDNPLEHVEVTGITVFGLRLWVKR